MDKKKSTLKRFTERVDWKYVAIMYFIMAVVSGIASLTSSDSFLYGQMVSFVFVTFVIVLALLYIFINIPKDGNTN